MSEEGLEISPVDSGNLEPHIGQLTSHSEGTLGLDGEVEGGPVSILSDSGSGITSISKGFTVEV